MPGSPPAYSENTPFQAAEWLNAHPEFSGPLWAELAFSSYLAFATPQRPVWIYPRMETFPTAQWQQYLRINAATEGWQQALAAEGVCLVLADPHEQSDLVAALAVSTAWQLVYSDDAAVIYSCR